MEHAKSFYLDIAQVGTAIVPDFLLSWAPNDIVEYRSDHPYAVGQAEFNITKVDEYAMLDEDGERYYKGNGWAF